MGIANVLSVPDVYGEGWPHMDVVKFRDDVHAGRFLRDVHHADADEDRIATQTALTRLVRVVCSGDISSLDVGQFSLADLVTVYGQLRHWPSGELMPNRRIRLLGCGDTYQAYLWRLVGGLDEVVDHVVVHDSRVLRFVGVRGMQEDA